MLPQPGKPARNWKAIAYGLFQLLLFIAASAASLYILWGGELLASLVSYYDTTRDLVRYLVFIPILSIGLRYVERASELKFFRTNTTWVSLTAIFAITAVTWHGLMVQNGWYWDLAQNQAGRGVILVHLTFSLALTSILLNYEMPTTFRKRVAITIALVIAGLSAYDNWENLRHMASIGRPATDLFNSIADPAADALGSLTALIAYNRLVRGKHLLSKILPVKSKLSLDEARTRTAYH